MSDTPRTDATRDAIHTSAADMYVKMCHNSRQLERELTAAQAEIAELNQRLRALRLIAENGAPPRQVLELAGRSI